MNSILTLMRRELGAYFLSPVAYVVNAIFLFTAGLAFGLGTFRAGGEASLRFLFDPWVLVILMLLVPFLTMRLFSEEMRSGTIETLMTVPISETQVVVGKFLGAYVFYLILLSTILLYPLIMSYFGDLDVLLLLCNYLGLVLLGALYTAVGLFFSSVTRHQLIAVLLSVTLLVIFSLASFELAQVVDAGWTRVILQHFSIRAHFHDFVRGMVDVNHLVFFVTTTFAFLFLTVKKLEMRRWK
jgi:ABC-2 type transport system permease protein